MQDSKTHLVPMLLKKMVGSYVGGNIRYSVAIKWFRGETKDRHTIRFMYGMAMSAACGLNAFETFSASPCSNQSLSAKNPKYLKLLEFLNLPSLYKMVIKDAFVLCRQIFYVQPGWFEVGTTRQQAAREKLKYDQLPYHEVKIEFRKCINDSAGPRARSKPSLLFELDKAARAYVTQCRDEYDDKQTPKICEFDRLYKQIFQSSDAPYKEKMNTFIFYARDKFKALEMLDRVCNYRTPSLSLAQKRLTTPPSPGSSNTSWVVTPKRIKKTTLPPSKPIPLNNRFESIQVEDPTSQDSSNEAPTTVPKSSTPVPNKPSQKLRKRCVVCGKIASFNKKCKKALACEICGVKYCHEICFQSLPSSSNNPLPANFSCSVVDPSSPCISIRTKRNRTTQYTRSKKRRIYARCDYCHLNLPLDLDENWVPKKIEGKRSPNISNHLMNSCPKVDAEVSKIEKKYRGSKRVTRCIAIAKLSSTIGQKGYYFTPIEAEGNVASSAGKPSHAHVRERALCGSRVIIRPNPY